MVPQPLNINNQPSTILHVEEGLVRFLRLADRKSVDVAAGEFAVAGATPDDFLLKAYPSDTEWIDGRILFEDDFSEGLKHWTIGQLREDRDNRHVFEPLDPQGVCSIEPKRERIRGQDVYGILMRQNDLTRRDSPYGKPVPVIMLNRAITAPAFAVEWEYRLTTRDDIGSQAGPHYVNVSDFEMIEDEGIFQTRSDQEFDWYTNRGELIPLGSTEAPYRWKHRVFSNGKRMAVSRINLDAEKTAFKVTFGEGFINRCTIRELIPASGMQARAVEAPAGESAGATVRYRWDFATGLVMAE